MIAVNAAAPMKKTSNAINTHAIPLILRRFFAAKGVDPEPTASGPPWLPKAGVSVSAKLPKRNPQFRQKRSSDGIAEWQLEQVVRLEVKSPGKGISVFCDIGGTCVGS
jgi:hypothetical protein